MQCEKEHLEAVAVWPEVKIIKKKKKVRLGVTALPKGQLEEA